MKKTVILTVFFLIGCVALQAQSAYAISGKSIYEIRTQAFPMWSLPTYSTEALNLAPSTLQLETVKPDWTAHYFAHLGFFCKVELKLEHQTRFPVKFRLGTVDYTERLEGKRASY